MLGASCLDVGASSFEVNSPSYKGILISVFGELRVRIDLIG